MSDRPRPRGSPLRWATIAILLSAVGVIVVLGMLVAARNRPPAIELPLPRMPSPNMWDDSVRIAALMPGNGGPFDARGGRADRQPEIRSAMVLLRRALHHDMLEPPVRNTRAWDPLRSAKTCLPIGTGLRRMSRIARTEGRLREAADWALDGMEYGICVQNGAASAWMTGARIYAAAVSELEAVLPTLNRSELARVAGRLLRIERRAAPIRDMVLEEGHQQVALVRDGLAVGQRTGILGRWRSTTEILWPTWSPGGPSTGRTHAPSLVDSAGMVLADKTAMLRDHLRYHSDLADEVTGPWRGRLRTPPSFIGRMAAGVLLRMLAEQAPGERQQRTVLMAEVAVLRHRADRGAYPKALANLVPRYLASVPTDECAARPGVALRYVRQPTGRGFVLYGVGLNMRDDGGRPAPPNSKQGDIVAGCLTGRSGGPPSLRP